MTHHTITNELPQRKKEDIGSALHKRPLENTDTIAEIEASLQKARGYVFRMPPPGTPVIMLSSGGVDSTVMSDMLMNKYGLVIFPLFLRRGQRRIRKELSALAYFSKLFKQKYPSLYQDPFVLNAPIPPMEIRWQITDVADIILDRKTRQRRGIPMYSNMLASYAIQYAYWKELKNNIRIRTIFCGFITKDGIGMAYETLTALRAVMLTIISLTHDTSWQFTSLAIEKECGFFWDKDVLLRWAVEQHIPIEKTWSCYWAGLFHCGTCDGCRTRREAFQRIGLFDKTCYWSDLPLGPIQRKIHRLVRKLTIAKQKYI